MRFRVLLLLLAFPAAGCSLIRPPPDEPPVVEAPAPEPVTATPTPPAPAPAPAPEPEPPPSSYEPPVAVVLSSRAAAYEGVALALDGLLGNSEIYDLSDRSLSARDAFERIAASDARAVVAIGLRAAVYARDSAEVPVVFSQVFNVSGNGLVGDTLRGIAVLPPLEKQLGLWRDVSPGIRSIGAIVGAGHESLLDEGRRAAVANGLEFHFRIASSDRETLYHFTRLAPNIDAFWLFPDNRILSASVLKEMLDYAARHRIEVAVFNDALLELDPALSTTADETDIAWVVMQVLHRIDAGEIDDVPEVSPLREVRLTLGGKHPQATNARRSSPVAEPPL